jgi:hypothetical protein
MSAAAVSRQSAAAVSRQSALPRVLRAIARITVVTGAAQAAWPGLVLGELSPRPGPMDRQLFGTIGMFMVVSGGTLDRALAAPRPDRGVVLWAAAQKLGASAAMSIGVGRGLYARRALAVAGFDLLSGLGCLAYARQLGNGGTGAP